MNPLDPSWLHQKKCLSCGLKLFPYSAQDAEDWAVWCYYESQKRRVSPATLMKERAPRIEEQHSIRPPRIEYY
jgi:hypothetical protein